VVRMVEEQLYGSLEGKASERCGLERIRWGGFGRSPWKREDHGGVVELRGYWFRVFEVYKMRSAGVTELLRAIVRECRAACLCCDAACEHSDMRRGQNIERCMRTRV
jgi:hypothetical protein